MIDYEQYLIEGEPGRAERAKNWMAAIGLQDVDGLKPSPYLIENVRKNIEGEISIGQVSENIENYYETVEGRRQDVGTIEADKVATRINEILSSGAFNYRPVTLANIHRRLFAGVYKFAGLYRDYNIKKKEWVLRGDSVRYESAQMISDTLEFEFNQEKNYIYKNKSMPDIIKHLARFVANIWQVHPFGEGNTRTTSVFFIQMLRHLGFSVDNGVFAGNSWYFRNALVRANYSNLQLGVRETTVYVEAFLRNLLMGESNDLRSRNLLISESWEENVAFKESDVLKSTQELQNTQKSTQETTQEIANSTQEIQKTTQEKQGVTQETTQYVVLKGTAKMIVETMVVNPSVTRNELALIVGVSADAIKKQIEKLKALGVIRRVGATKNGRWEVLRS